MDDIDEAVKCFTAGGAKLVRGVFDYPACKIAIMTAHNEDVIVYQDKQ